MSLTRQFDAAPLVMSRSPSSSVGVVALDGQRERRAGFARLRHATVADGHWAM
jgi:hypothetical protein